MRNETEFIKSTSERTLTAKAYKFVWKCIDIIAEQNGFNRYSKELKPLKEKLQNLLVSLFIDKRLSINEIKELIKNRTIINGLN
mgnify:CR=1